MQNIFPNLYLAIQYCRNLLINFGHKVMNDRWQGVALHKHMLEIDNVYFQANMPENYQQLVNLVHPDLPWAENHFRERVSGEPLNPGNEFKNWPYYGQDKTFRNVEGGKFTHTYMERYWPKLAEGGDPNWGIRYKYGDLKDVVNLLIKDITTRQAYLPVWFPEDTGVLHGGRVPCSIGYHFIVRYNKLNIHYLLRSCDMIRHFKNDIFLTVRLAHYIKAKIMEEINLDLQIGMLTMDIINLHCFDSEKHLI